MCIRKFHRSTVIQCTHSGVDIYIERVFPLVITVQEGTYFIEHRNFVFDIAMSGDIFPHSSISDLKGSAVRKSLLFKEAFNALIFVLQYIVNSIILVVGTVRFHRKTVGCYDNAALIGRIKRCGIPLDAPVQLIFLLSSGN